MFGAFGATVPAPAVSCATVASWAKEWSDYRGGKIPSKPEEIQQAATELFEMMAVAHDHRGLFVEENPIQRRALPDLPDGAEILVINGPVRSAWILWDRAGAIWLGYTVAGNGTATYVFPATREMYDTFVSYLP